MKLYAVKVKRNTRVLADPSRRFASPVRSFMVGEYAVLSDEQINLIDESSIDLICEVKKRGKPGPKTKKDS